MAPHPGAYCGWGNHTSGFKADLGAIHGVQVGADDGEKRAPAVGRDQVPRGAQGSQGARNCQHLVQPSQGSGRTRLSLTPGKGAQALTHSCSWGRWRIRRGQGGTGRARGPGTPPRRSTGLPGLRPGHRRREPCIGPSHCPAWRHDSRGWGDSGTAGAPRARPVLGTPQCQVQDRGVPGLPGQGTLGAIDHHPPAAPCREVFATE